MRIVYHCVDGLFDSPLAAAIHLGLVAEDSPPTVGELRAFPHYGRVERVPGRLYHAGVDEHGNQVFTLGRKKFPGFVTKVLEQAHRTLFEVEEPLLFFDCQVMGGLFCTAMRHLLLRDPQFLNWAIRRSRKAHPHLVQVVRGAKARISRG